MLAYLDGRLSDAIGSAERAYALFERLGDRTGAAVTLLGHARIATAAGMPERARAAYTKVIALADELDRPALKAAALANLAVLEMHEARFREAADLARESLALARRLGTLDWVAFAAESLAGAQVALGDYEGALASVRECIEAVHAFRGEGPRSGFLLYILAAVAAGIGEGRVGARLLPTGDRLMQRLGNAPEPYTGDLRRSTERTLRSRLGPAFDEVFESGRSLSVDQAIEEGLTLEVPAPRPGPTGPHHGRGGRSRHDLTPRELEVLSLVAAGRSDGEIAQALFISKKTASVHVANIKDKLAAASRIEIALTAQRLGLTAPVGDHARHARS
jgi:DNA-binding CsgD family transcriptional regulator